MPFATHPLVSPRIAAGLCAAAVITSARAGMAQAAGNKAAAEAVFEQGKLLMQSGNYQQACSKFEASQKLDQGIGTLLYLGDCYERLGRTASAWATFKEAASMAGAQGQDSRQKLATQRARTLEPNLIKLTIEVAPGDESLLGFEVRNDGVAVASAQFAAPFPIDPGTHRIEASAPGKKTHVEVINAARGTSHVSIPLLSDLPAGGAPESMPPPRPVVTGSVPASTGSSLAMAGTSQEVPHTDTTDDQGKTQRTVSFIAGGLGVVGVGLGTYFGLAALHDNSSSKADCNPNPNVCGSAGYDQRQDALREARISTVAFAAGGALLATAAVLYFTARSSHHHPITAQAQVMDQSAFVNLRTEW
jgi:serine/threonine-protein kinase